MVLPRLDADGQDERQRSALAVGGEVDFGGLPAPGPPEQGGLQAELAPTGSLMDHPRAGGERGRANPKQLRPGPLPGAALPGLVPPHHPVHGRPRLPHRRPRRRIRKWGTTDGGDELISSNAGKTWHQVSGTRTAVVGSTASSYAPMTAWYADGAKLLARACVREHFGHTDTKQACTAAH